MDRSPLTKAEEKIKGLEWFIDELKAVDNPPDETQSVIDILSWHLSISRQHYRNLLHCYSIGERSQKKVAT